MGGGAPKTIFELKEKKPEIEIRTGPIDSSAMNIEERFRLPKDYIRKAVDSNSFTHYLRRLSLFPLEHQVRYYDGNIKESNGVYCSVVNLPIGTRDRHQCADAVMNVRAHYLYSIQDYERIHFNYTSGFKASYSEWRKGKRIRVSGNNVNWYQTDKESKSYNSFLEYLQNVYSYAGTYSLDKELIKVKEEEIQPGDVFIKGGFPGHAILVLDVARHIDTGEKIFLLGQSYMPAQELQVLINPSSPELSPWYSANKLGKLITPEWVFDEGCLKRFEE